MGGASPYRARFAGLPRGGSPSADGEGSLGENGEKLFGLVNVANTCYVNSVLQALYFCTPFRKLAIQHLVEDKDDPSGDSLLVSLAELFAQIEYQKRSVGCITPRRFLQRLRKSNELFSTAEHQDAHEFLQFLLNDIVEHLRKRMRKKPPDKQQAQPSAAAQMQQQDGSVAHRDEPRTWVHDIFQGMLVNQTRCLCCEEVTVRRETFLDLSVDIERHTSLASCLRAFESTEMLRAGNKFFCETCGCLQEAEKRLRICQLPNVLTLHLKRFKYVEKLGRSCRLPYRVVFPLQLRVVEGRSSKQRHHTSGSRQQSQPPPHAGSEHHAHVEGMHNHLGYGGGATAVGSSPSAAGTDGSPSPAIRRFELRSVVVHIGRDSSRGHYVTVVRARNDHYVLLDDDVVRVVEPEVLRSFYGTVHGTSSQGAGGYNDPHHHRHHHGSSNSHWHAGDGGGGAHDMGGGSGGSDRYHNGNSAPSQSIYERAPEGTCCGYLLVYESVGESTSSTAADVNDNTGLDLGAMTDWISEERHMFESEGSSESGDDPPAAIPEHNAAGAEDIEIAQAFEQRCVPRGLSAKQHPQRQEKMMNGAQLQLQQQHQQPHLTQPQQLSPAPVSPHGRGGTRGAAPQLQSSAELHAAAGPGPATPSGGVGSHSGAIAWTSSEEDGAGRTQLHAGNGSSIAHASHVGMRTLGSVVPAAGASDAVSPSKVNVVTASPGAPSSVTVAADGL